MIALSYRSVMFENHLSLYSAIETQPHEYFGMSALRLLQLQVASYQQMTKTQLPHSGVVFTFQYLRTMKSQVRAYQFATNSQPPHGGVVVSCNGSI